MQDDPEDDRTEEEKALDALLDEDTAVPFDEDVDETITDFIRRLSSELTDGDLPEALELDTTGDDAQEAFEEILDAKRALRRAIAEAEERGLDPDAVADLRRALANLDEAQKDLEEALKKLRRQKELDDAFTKMRATLERLEEALRDWAREADPARKKDLEADLDEAAEAYGSAVRRWLIASGLTPEQADYWIDQLDPKNGKLIRPWLPQPMEPPRDHPRLIPDNRTEEQRLRDLGNAIRNMLRLLTFRSPYTGPNRINEQYLEKMVREYNERVREFNRTRNRNAEGFRPIETLPSPRRVRERAQQRRRTRRTR